MGPGLLRRKRRVACSLPFLLSAVAVLFLTAMPWTPPARPDRDLGFSSGRRAGASRLGSRFGAGRAAGAALSHDFDAPFAGLALLALGTPPFPRPAEPSSVAPPGPASATWARPSSGASPRGPPAA